MITEITPEALRSMLPLRPDDGHKGTFGHVLILAGSRGFTGAAKLTAEAAGRSGVGLVTVAVPRTLGDIVASSLLEAMSILLPSTNAESFDEQAVGPALQAAHSRSAVVLGPGISQHEDTRRFVTAFVAQCPVPLLIDADGLNCISHAPSVLTNLSVPAVLTPHPGEMARLVGCTVAEVQQDRESVSRAFASKYGCTVVLKGKDTLVAAPDGTCYRNPTGNSGMATGGTGDVLAGLMGGLLAQGMFATDAARLAVYLHGRAGEFASLAYTQRGMIARDVIAALPGAWRELEREK